MIALRKVVLMVMFLHPFPLPLLFLQNLCYDIAKELGVRHAALPIGQYIDMVSRKVLTVNQCFEIMSNW